MASLFEDTGKVLECLADHAGTPVPYDLLAAEVFGCGLHETCRAVCLDCTLDSLLADQRVIGSKAEGYLLTERGEFYHKYEASMEANFVYNLIMGRNSLQVINRKEEDSDENNAV